jgi:hypothetical protein
MTIPALIVTVVLLLVALVAINSTMTNSKAQANGYTAKNWESHTLLYPTPITTTVTAATTTPVTGVRYGEVEVYASINDAGAETLATEAALTYKIQTSNDGSNWSDASSMNIVAGTAVAIPYPTQTLNHGKQTNSVRIPMSGQQVRIVWTKATTHTIYPALDLLFKNTAGQ